MKKSDLKTGMTVETKDGKRGKVMLGTKNGDIIAGGDSNDKQTWKPLDCIHEDLTSNWSIDVDIVKVYDFGGNYNAASTSKVGKLLWERMGSLTIEEAEEMLGRKIIRE